MTDQGMAKGEVTGMEKAAEHSYSFELLVAEVLDSLPPSIGVHLQNVEVIIEPRLTRKVRQRYGLGREEVVYGLYEGVPLPERESYEMYLPAIIVIFQEPLEQDYPDPEVLRREVRRTLLHELAHHLGISDERLEELGAY